MTLEKINAVFAKDKTAFMPYVPLGYPTLETSLDVVRAVVSAGADMVELGVPFSDPLADGPTIQAATQIALEKGMTVPKALNAVSQLRAEGIDVPFLLMGYINPFMAYGLQKLATDAEKVGVDGFIVPDLPPEESMGFDRLCQANDLALVYFLAPTSTAERITLVAQKARGFIYMVSVTGVTGARSELADTLPDFVSRVRAATGIPLAVGFGIGNGEQAHAVGQFADGVIVGSALVKATAQSVDAARNLALEISIALE